MSKSIEQLKAEMVAAANAVCVTWNAWATADDADEDEAWAAAQKAWDADEAAKKAYREALENANKEALKENAK